MEQNDLENLVRLLASIASSEGVGFTDFVIRVQQNGSGWFQVDGGKSIAFVGPNTFAEQVRNAIKDAS